MFQIADAKVITEAVDGTKAGLFETAGLDPDRVSFRTVSAQGDAGNVESIAKSLSTSDADIFFVVGTSATIALGHLEKRRPIITIGMADPVAAKIATTLDAPGRNITGSTDYVGPGVQLDEILKVAPRPKTIGTIFDPSQPNAVKWVREFESAANVNNIAFIQRPATGTGDIGIAARSLVGKVDALIIGNDANTLAGVTSIASTAMQSKIPLYLDGGDISTPGVFATVGPKHYDVGKLAGRNAGLVCRGANPASIPFGRPPNVVWGINAETMKVLGLTVPPEIIQAATR
ncbi:ABC transporter substrate-binding protein [Nocardia asiatica]|uniref:ABC transporter substrate-binding protein n=1 Tax=Nocardia asiatica TaxID=209252 RepID=UPI001C3F4B68|nr:ABC transporter substrate-binding protein [Nocardia asiatica]